MNEQEKKIYREKLRQEYKDLRNFKSQFLLWRNHHSELTHYLDSSYVEEYISASKNPQDSYSLADVRNLIDKEFEEKGCCEPIPISDEDKSFIGEYWFNEILQYRKKEKPPIYDYKTYKEMFLNEVVGKADKLEYANKELLNVFNYLENLTFNSEPVFTLNGENKSVKVFFEDLTNNKNDFMPDFAQLYGCSILDANISLDLYYLASYYIPLNQHKRFLKIYIEKKGNLGTDNSKLFGYNLGVSENQLNELYLKLIETGFITSTIKLSHFINAFNGKPLSEDFKKLQWNKDATNLSLFIATLKHKNKWKKAEMIFLNIKSGNLRKSYNIAKELDIHKSANRQLNQILDSIGIV